MPFAPLDPTSVPIIVASAWGGERPAHPVVYRARVRRGAQHLAQPRSGCLCWRGHTNIQPLKTFVPGLAPRSRPKPGV